MVRVGHEHGLAVRTVGERFHPGRKEDQEAVRPVRGRVPQPGHPVPGPGQQQPAVRAEQDPAQDGFMLQRWAGRLTRGSVPKPYDTFLAPGGERLAVGAEGDGIDPAVVGNGCPHRLPRCHIDQSSVADDIGGQQSVAVQTIRQRPRRGPRALGHDDDALSRRDLPKAGAVRACGDRLAVGAVGDDHAQAGESGDRLPGRGIPQLGNVSGARQDQLAVGTVGDPEDIGTMQERGPQRLGGGRIPPLNGGAATGEARPAVGSEGHLIDRGRVGQGGAQLAGGGVPEPPGPVAAAGEDGPAIRAEDGCIDRIGVLQGWAERLAGGDVA